MFSAPAHVKELTAWCEEMVVVPKASGRVRICVDMKPLIKNVLCKTHSMPKVDTTLAQLTGATMFSKLDGVAFGESLWLQSLDC